MNRPEPIRFPGSEAPDAKELRARALAAFETTLAFLPEAVAGLPPPGVKGQKQDPVLHLRIATIHFTTAQMSDFRDEEAVSKALEHYKESLRLTPTAEAWRCAGICTNMKAQMIQPLPEKAHIRRAYLEEAISYFREANMLDNCQPQCNAWLVICAVQLGRVQVAKQTFRQVLRYADRLRFEDALRLTQVLLRFSDEHGPDVQTEERGPLVLDGRYAKEAAAAARLALQQQSGHGDAQLLLAQALVLMGEDAAAVEAFCMAIPLLEADPVRQDEVGELARERAVAPALLGEPRWQEMVKKTLSTVQELRGGGDPLLGEDGLAE